MMKRMIFILVVCAFITVPILADPVDYTHGVVWYGGIANARYDPVNYSFGSGGEFAMYSDELSPGLLLGNDAYAPTTKGIYGGETSFQTFCMELDEDVINPVHLFVSESEFHTMWLI